MKKITILLVTVLMLFLPSIGCNKDSENQKNKLILSEWKTVLYCRADQGDFWGKTTEDGTTYMFYELDGLNPNDYLIANESSVVNATSACTVWMNEDALHPIKVCDVKKVDIKWNNTNKTVEDKQVINKLLDIIRNEEPVVLQYSPTTPINTVIYFDLPCNLALDCSITREDNNSLHIICFDEMLGKYISYNVTDAFKDILH